MNVDQLASIGVSNGSNYWSAELGLESHGYVCYVHGAKREKFDCEKKVGFLGRCVLRIDFEVDESNAVSSLRIAEPGCGVLTP